MAQLDLDADWGRMRNGYRQNSFGFGQLLQHSPGLGRRLMASGQQVAARYRRTAPRGTETHSRSADDVKVRRTYPGGRKKDRQAVMVIAKPRNKEGTDALIKSVSYLSGGKKISKKGQVS